MQTLQCQQPTCFRKKQNPPLKEPLRSKQSPGRLRSTASWRLGRCPQWGASRRKSRGMVDTAAVPKKIYISSCLDMNKSHFVVQPFQRNLVIRLQGGDLAVLFRSQTEQPEDLIAWDLWRLHIESIAQYHRMLSVGFGDSTPTALLQSFECCEIHARYDPFKPRWVVMHSSSS